MRRKSVDKSMKSKSAGKQQPPSSLNLVKKNSRSPDEAKDVESDISSSTSTSQRRYTSSITSTSSASEAGSEKHVESGTLTLGRRKKKAPQPPKTPVQEISPKLRTKTLNKAEYSGGELARNLLKMRGNNTIERSGVRTKEREKSKQSSRSSFTATFKANYHGNNLVKEFNGIETTREAIEKVKGCKDLINRTGMPVTLLVSEKSVKISIFEGKDPIHHHLITNISCIVYDTDNMCMFGYITSDIENLQRFSHVFSAENKEKASEILTAICNGYKESSSKHKESKKSSSSQKKTGDVELRKLSSGADIKENRASRSDQLVSRMRNFFQGGDSSGRSYSVSHKKLSSASEARRRRGGSMDNLIDSIDSGE